MKYTKLERNWVMYDVGNSAFVLMVATLIPIFFNALAESGGLTSVEYLAYWGYASSVVTIITAILSPILGTVADTRGFKKPIFMLCVGVGIVGCCAIPRHLRHCEGGIFGQSGVLRLHARGCDHAGADG